MTIRERYQLLREFHRRVNEPAHDSPTEPARDHAELRARLVLEEALELVAALGVGIQMYDANGYPVDAGSISVDKIMPVNFVRAVDAMRDLEYVIHGTDLVLGTSAAAEDTFEEVHRSNMGKEAGVGDGAKAIKPADWRPPELKEILRRTFPKHRILFEE